MADTLPAAPLGNEVIIYILVLMNTTVLNPQTFCKYNTKFLVSTVKQLNLISCCISKFQMCI